MKESHPLETMTPKRTDGISICIPNWHHRNYLPRCVGSALAAARHLAAHNIACEVLVVDDYSRDGSQRLLLSMAMADPTGALHAVLAPHNRGLAATRNEAMKQAQFRWVCFLDADNEVCPENLVFFYKAAVETGATMLYGNLICRTEEGVAGIVSNDVVHEGILEQNYIDAMTVVNAEQILALGGFDNHPYVRAHEDWELVLHLISEGQLIVMVPVVLGIYYHLPLSMIRETEHHHSKVHRMFNQRKIGLPSSFRSRVYHPDLGYLI